MDRWVRALKEIEGSYMYAARVQEELILKQRDSESVTTLEKAHAMLKLGELYGRYKAVLAGKVVKVEALRVYGEALKVLKTDTDDYAKNYPNETAEALLGIASQHLYDPEHCAAGATQQLAYTNQLIATNLDLAGEMLHTCGNFAKEALVLDTQSDFHQQQGQMDLARENLESALKLRQTHLVGAQKDRECAGSFMSLGKLFTKMREHRQSLAYYEKAKAAYTSGFGENHPSILPAYESAVIELEIVGNYAEAAIMQQQLVERERVNPNVEGMYKAQNLNKLGELYGRYKAVPTGKLVKVEALKVYEEALEVLKVASALEKAVGVTELYPNETAEALFGIACQHLYSPAVEEDLENGEIGALEKVEADALIKANLEQAEALWHENGNFAKEALVLDTQGNFNKQNGRMQSARQNMEAALELREQHLQGAQKDRECAASFMSLGNFYSKLAEYDGALTYFERAQSAYTRGFGFEHPKVLPAFEGIILALSALKQFKKAREELMKAVVAEKMVERPNFKRWESLDKKLSKESGMPPLLASEDGQRQSAVTRSRTASMSTAPPGLKTRAIQKTASFKLVAANRERKPSRAVPEYTPGMGSSIAARPPGRPKRSKLGDGALLTSWANETAQGQ
jgi:tetratricopeptide (TPR) repeat protein